MEKIELKKVSDILKKFKQIKKSDENISDKEAIKVAVEQQLDNNLNN